MLNEPVPFLCDEIGPSGRCCVCDTETLARIKRGIDQRSWRMLEDPAVTVHLSVCQDCQRTRRPRSQIALIFLGSALGAAIAERWLALAAWHLWNRGWSSGLITLAAALVVGVLVAAQNSTRSALVKLTALGPADGKILVQAPFPENARGTTVSLSPADLKPTTF